VNLIIALQHEIIHVASLRRYLRSSLLMDCSLCGWRRRGVPPRFGDHDDDSAENDKPMNTCNI
jgi:hypothetical protein